MTFAIVRNGVILDLARVDTFWELAARLGERKGTSTVILDLRPGESPRVGDQVDVDELLVGVARLVRADGNATLATGR